MRFALFLISALLCSALAQEFALPNLNVNTDDVNCQNAQASLATAQADLDRLTKFVNQDLVDAKADADNAICLTKRSCNVAVVGPAPSMLQAQKSSKVAKSSMLSLEEFTQTIESRERSDLYNQLIADKFDDAVGMMLEVSSTSKQSNDVYTQCTETITRLESLSSYLDTVGQQVTSQYINGYLPQRIAYINSLAGRCANSLVTQTGTVQRTYYATSSPMWPANSYVRTDDYQVTFNNAFDEAPSVGVALIGNDVNQGTPVFTVEATDVTPTSFNLRVTAPANVGLNAIQISYIATISSLSGIYLDTASVDSQVDSAAAVLSSPPQDNNPRVVTKAINQPGGLTNIRSFAVIRDYNIKPGNDGRFSVATSADSTSVTFQAIQNSLINAVTATLVFWSGSDGSITQYAPEVPKSGPLSQGVGARDYPVKLDTSAYSAAPEYFFGLYQFEIYENSGYRLTQATSWLSTSTLQVDFNVWYYTEIDWVRDNLIFTCTYSDKSKCLF